MTEYKLNISELRCVMLFLRDYDWEIIKQDNLVLAKFIYNTCDTMYIKLEKRCLRLLASKWMEKQVKYSFSELELMSLSILAKHPHDRNEINSVIHKVLLNLPIEVIRILQSNKK